MTDSFLHSESSASRISLDIDMWTRIVFAAQESEDWKLRGLIEQAVAGAQLDILSIPEKPRSGEVRRGE